MNTDYQPAPAVVLQSKTAQCGFYIQIYSSLTIPRFKNPTKSTSSLIPYLTPHDCLSLVKNVASIAFGFSVPPPEIPDAKQNTGQEKSRKGDGDTKIEIKVLHIKKAFIVGFFKEHSDRHDDQKKHSNADDNQMNIFFAEIKNDASYTKRNKERYETKPQCLNVHKYPSSYL